MDQNDKNVKVISLEPKTDPPKDHKDFQKLLSVEAEMHKVLGLLDKALEDQDEFPVDSQ